MEDGENFSSFATASKAVGGPSAVALFSSRQAANDMRRTNLSWQSSRW